jgi:hypothetical protein
VFAAAIACSAATMLVGAGVGEATSPPAVTHPATAVTSTSAALNGVINPSGLDTFWEFQWGTTTAYGRNTTPSGPIRGTSVNSVLAPIRGLQPDTTYHFRLVVVQGAAGVSGQATIFGGQDATFTTPATSGPGGNNSQNKHAHASLGSHTLAVHHGDALIAWGCSGTKRAICKGTISLSARGNVGGKIKTVNCGGGRLIATTGTHHTVRAHLGNDCLSLVEHARHHRLAASLVAYFTQGTGNLLTRVTLVLG